MRRLIPLAALSTLVLAACSEGSPATPFEPTATEAAARSGADIYLVTFRDGVDVPTNTRDLARLHGLAVRSTRLHAAPGFSAIIPEARIDALRADPRVAIVERDGPVTLVRPIDVAAGKPPKAEVVPWGVQRVGGPGDGTGKTAWVIDSGIDLDHPDLNTTRNCHVSYVTRGKYSAEDGNGHGTHVAGTIAAKDNDIDVVGVAANAFVCSVRVLDNSGSGTWEWVVNGVNHVAGNGANGDVANMSLGASGSHATLEKAVSDAAAKGIRFVLAAGNNGAHASGFTPARVNGPNIYTISAIASNGCLTSWSNYGNPPVDYAAPGSGIESTRNGGGTTTMSGTSMAAPHVAGLLLLGAVRSSGSACNDPDGNPDPIAHR